MAETARPGAGCPHPSRVFIKTTFPCTQTRNCPQASGHELATSIAASPVKLPHIDTAGDVKVYKKRRVFDPWHTKKSRLKQRGFDEQ